MSVKSRSFLTRLMSMEKNAGQVDCYRGSRRFKTAQQTPTFWSQVGLKQTLSSLLRNGLVMNRSSLFETTR